MSGKAGRDLVSCLAELAMSAASLHSFQENALPELCRAIGADHGAFFGFQGGKVDVASSSGDDALLARDMPRFIAEMDRREAALALANRSVSCEEVHSAARRESLAMYREYLSPRGLARHMLRTWQRKGRLSWFAFAPYGATDFTRFASRSAPLLDQAFPVLALTESFFTRPAATNDCEVSRERSREYGLTSAEHDTLCLVARGLTNQEIADLLGLSLHTVRNRLVSCFEKLDVSRRTEAIFLLSERCAGEAGGTPYAKRR